MIGVLSYFGEQLGRVKIPMTYEKWTAKLHARIPQEIGYSTFFPFFALHAIRSTKTEDEN